MAKAADEYLQRCSGNDQFPDVFEFLASRDGLGERSQVDILLVDQFQRWKLNQVIPVDQYLNRTPSISDVFKVELLIEEFGYLSQRGIAPAPEEFAKRYSALAPDARMELYEALEIDNPEEVGSSGSSNSARNLVSSRKTPELIGRYQVVRMLGKGAFGKVFLAKDPDLDRSVAIKVPTNTRVRMGGGVEEFLNEARAVAKLDHPNIVPVYDCGLTEDDRCFVVSKFIRGKELRAEIRKGIPHRESAWIVGLLARALHVAHVAGIVHRDVKPGNIIIDTKRQPHLLDFGLAFNDQDDFDSEALIGTPAYMSPEQAEGGSHRVDGRSDIYSLAVVFYEMLTGHRPFKSDKTADLLAQLKLGEIRPPRQSDDTIPVELEQICLKALSRELAGRYSTAKDMADEIENWLIETSTEVDSFFSSGRALASSDSHRSSFSSRSSKRVTSGTNIPIVSSLISRPIIVIGIIAIGLTALAMYLNSPTDSPDSNHSPIVASSNKSDSSNNLDPHDNLNAVPETQIPMRVAVLGFRNLSTDLDHSDYAWLASGFAELLTKELSKSEELNLVTSENVSLMKTDLDLSNSDSLGPSTLRRVKNRLDADWVVLGSYQPTGDDNENIRFNVTVQSTVNDKAKIEFSNSVAREQWLDLLAVSSAQLRRELKLKAPNIADTGQLLPAAPNLEASKHYFEGLMRLQSFDLPGAKALFESAALADPDSPLIQELLSQVNMELGNPKLAREYSAKAVALCESLPVTHQLAIKGKHQLLMGRPTEAVASFRSLAKENNKSIESQLQLASAMTTAGQGRQALALLDEIRVTSQHGATNARVDLESARAAQSVSEFSKQVEFAESAVKSARQVDAQVLEGHASLVEGEGRKRMSQHNESLVCFERALKLFGKHGDDQNAATTIAAWAKALIDNGQLDLAETKIEEGMELSKSLGNQQLISKHKGLLGELAIYRGEFEEATKLLQSALQSFTVAGDWQGVAGMNLTLANVLARTGKLDKALNMVAAARKAFQTTGNRLAEARTWGQEGAMRARTGDSIEGQRYFERALELFREVGDQRNVAICLGDLASTQSNQGRLTKAGELYSEALELHRQLGSKRGPEMVMFNLSNLYARTGRFEESLNLMSESLKRFEKLNVGMNVIFVKRKLADIQMKRGELALARQTISETLISSKEAKNLAVEAQSLYTMHQVAVLEGDFEQAVEYIVASKNVSNELKQELRVAFCDFALAYVKLRLQDPTAALKLLQSSESKLVSLQPELKPMLLFVRARAESNAGKLSDAKESFQKANDATDKHPTEDLTVRLARLHERALALKAMGQADDATHELKQVIQLADKYGWLSLNWEARVQFHEWSRANQKKDIEKEITQLNQTVSAKGFLDFANRLEEIQRPNETMQTN